MDVNHTFILNKNSHCVNKLCKKVKVLDCKLKKVSKKCRDMCIKAFGEMRFNNSTCEIDEYAMLFDIDEIVGCRWYALNQDIFEMNPCYNEITLTECQVTDQEENTMLVTPCLEIAKDGCFNVSLTGNLVLNGNEETARNFELGLVVNPSISNALGINPVATIVNNFNLEKPSTICLNTYLNLNAGDQLAIFIRFESDIGEVVMIGTNWFSLLLTEL